MRHRVFWGLLGFALLLLLPGAPRRAAAAEPDPAPSSRGATCGISVDPMCAFRPNSTVTLKFTMRNSGPKKKRFIIAVDLEQAWRVDVGVGQTKSKTVRYTVGTATYRLQPRAWCAEFILPDLQGPAQALLDSVNQQTAGMRSLRTRHSSKRSMIHTQEQNAIVAAQAGDDAVVQTLLGSLDILEAEDSAILQQIESRSQAIDGLFAAYGGGFPMSAAIAEMDLVAFDRDLAELTEAQEDNPGLRTFVNADNDNDADGNNETVDRLDGTVAQENDLLPCLSFFARPIDSSLSFFPITHTLRAENGGPLRTWQKPEKESEFALPQNTSADRRRSHFFIEGVQPTGDAPTHLISEWGACQEKARVRVAGLVFKVIDPASGGEVDLPVAAGQGLRIGPWMDAVSGLENNLPVVAANFITRDPERFRLELTDDTKKGAGTVKVKVKTERRIGGALTELNPFVELTLTEKAADPGVFETAEPLLLMSDIVDDLFSNASTGGVDDDAAGDRTLVAHRGGLRDGVNGRVRTEYLIAGKPCHAAAPVCDTAAGSPMKVLTVEVHFIIVDVAGVGVVPNAVATADLENLNERFAQAGIQFKSLGISHVAEPQGIKIGTQAGGADLLASVDLSNGLDERGATVDTTTPEEKALILGARAAAGHAAAAAHIDIIYINYFKQPAQAWSSTLGEAWHLSGLNQTIDGLDMTSLKNAVVRARYAGNPRVDYLDPPGTRHAWSSYTVTPHEVAHVLENSPGHELARKFADNLMYVGNVNYKQVYYGQRLNTSAAQRKIVRDAAAAQGLAK